MHGNSILFLIVVKCIMPLKLSEGAWLSKESTGLFISGSWVRIPPWAINFFMGLEAKFKLTSD